MLLGKFQLAWNLLLFKNPKFHYILAPITSPCYYFHTSSVNCVCSDILLLFPSKSKRYSE